MRDLCQFDLERWFGWSIITSLNLKMLCNKVLGPSFNWIQAREILVDENDRVAVHDPEYNCPLMEEHHRFLKPNNSVPKTLGPAHHLPNLHTHQTHHHTQHHQLIPHHHAHQPLFTSPSYMPTGVNGKSICNDVHKDAESISIGELWKVQFSVKMSYQTTHTRLIWVG